MHSSVFVTGGSGLLGVNWAVAMRDRLHVTLGMHGRSISIARVDSINVNLADEDALARSIETLGVPLVVHAAGLTSIEVCEANPTLAHEVNVVLAENVARACARVGVALAHISTDHLFAGDRDMLTEADPVSPVNVYGRTKAEAEYRVLIAKSNALVVRTNFFAWGPSYRQSFSDYVLNSLRAGRHVTLHQDVTFSPILAQPLIENIHSLVWQGTEGLCHVVGDESLTKLDFGRRLARHFNLPDDLILAGSMNDQARIVRRPRCMTLSNAKATSILGRPLGTVDQHISLLCYLEGANSTHDIRQL